MDDAIVWLRERWPWVTLIVVAIVVILVLMRLTRREGLPYRKRGPIVTKAERKFLTALDLAVKGRWRIFAMVRIADLLEVIPETPNRLTWFNRIACKHIDFVLCDPESLEPRGAIELDDATHQRADRQERDAFVDAAFAAAKLPLIRIPTAGEYDIDAIRDQLQKGIG
ncbi:MAG TPA: DUF2726 domain-containing protein [Pirellulaceae bacterium]|nr:DUF2726 domain-containing protein [Pirellulaceae bacterium]